MKNGIYDDLDNMILARVKSLTNVTGRVTFTDLHAAHVREECDRLQDALGRESFRILDGRLQELRRQGKLYFLSKLGWKIKERA